MINELDPKNIAKTVKTIENFFQLQQTAGAEHIKIVNLEKKLQKLGEYYRSINCTYLIPDYIAAEHR